MALYIAELIGAGTEDNPWRVPTEEPGQGWIDLRGDSRLAGHGLLYLPTPVSGPRLELIADDPAERLAVVARQRIGSRFSLVLRGPPGAQTGADAIRELLMEHHGGPRWKPLRPSRVRQRFEIFLGQLGAIWTQPQRVVPATTSFVETWPTPNDTDISTGQDQPWTVTENAINTDGSGRAMSASGSSRARCNTPLDTDDHEHYATWESTRDTTARRGSLHCRESTAAQTYYQCIVRRDSDAPGDLRSITKVIAGVSTGLASDTTDPGTAVEVRLIVDGSTITLKIGGTQIHQATDTEITGNVRVGITLNPPTTPTWDNHTMADLVVAALPTKSLVVSQAVHRAAHW